METIMTFNMRLDVSSDGKHAWRYRQAAVVSCINHYQPLVIGAQEVLPSMIKSLQPHLSNYTFFGEPREPEGESTPIIYREDLLEFIRGNTYWLSKTPGIPHSSDFDSAYKRICTWAELQFRNKRKTKFRIFNTHLDNESELARIEGLKIILKKIKELNKFQALPTILTGDFNDVPLSKTIQLIENDNESSVLRNTYDLLQVQPVATFHQFTGKETGLPIDYIFISTDIKINDINVITKRFNDMYVSDHFPVVVRISF